MEYRKMEALGIETSLLGFGCMRLPTDEAGKVIEDEAGKMLDTAMAAGVNYYDTAYPYLDGESERFVGKAMKKYDRSSFYLATKLPCWLVEKKEDVRRIFTEQLERLQTSYIDFYLLHALNKDRFEQMISLGVIEECEQLRAEGKIKYFGFSFHDSYESFEKIINYRKWDFCQIQYNFMDCEEQAGDKGYELAKSLNVPLIIMEPIKGGSLAQLPEDILPILHKHDSEASVSSWALRWVGTHSNVKVILSGMSTFAQVEDNLKTFKEFKPLSEQEQKAINEVAAALRARMQNGCTGCRYCMPCPAGVDISGNFKMWNDYHVYQNKFALDWQWNRETEEANKAFNCIKCGKCEKACPQKISIREDLERLTKDIGEILA